VLLDPTAPGKVAALTVVKRGTGRGDSVRTDRWRYTRWSDGTAELYDHAADPEETHNVVAAHADLVPELARLLPTEFAPESATKAKAGKKKK
jgi:hypothetical protein